MNTPGLIKSFTTAAVIPPFRIVQFGVDDQHVAASALATDGHIGTTGQVVPQLAPASIDVVMSDVSEVEYGGIVSRGDLLTADTQGRAITAAPAAGANVRIIGIAMVSGVLGDIGSLLINATQIQG